MRKYFGTDGIRRIANTELTPSLVYKVAKAGAYVLSKHTDHVPTILIGRDTRISGTLIESAMVAGFLSFGANVKLLGVIPTPAVAYLTRKLKADASVVISASHNTYEFNGIKFFSNKGMKIDDAIEEEIEEIMDSDQAQAEKASASASKTEQLSQSVVKPAVREDGKKQRPGLYLRVANGEDPLFAKAKTYLAVFDGTFPVYVYFKDRKKLTVAPQSMLIDPNRALFRHLVGLLGEENVAIVGWKG